MTLTLALLLTAAVAQDDRAPTNTSPPPRAALSRGTWELVGGRWFDGRGFVRRTMFVADGFFVPALAEKADRRLDLAGGFVVPPFGDAHTHNMAWRAWLKRLIRSYLREGTFYVQVLNNYRSGADICRAFVNRPDAVDVRYAHGGITSTLGHPFMAYEPRAMGLKDWTKWHEQRDEIAKSRIGAGDVYWFVDTLEDLGAKWPRVLAGKPDLIKILLLDAANHEKKATTFRLGERGLPPELVGPVIARAHAAGLRVFAHVETAADFRLALECGVDGFAHLPGYALGSKSDITKYRLSDETVRLAGERRVVVVPTTALAVGYAGKDEKRLGRMRELQRDGLRRLHAAGARIAIGYDNFGQTARPEALNLRELGVFDNRTLLKLWCEVTPRAIFPERFIGRLAPGYEASFLVLRESPLVDFRAVKEIGVRMKQGHLLDLADKEPPRK